MDMARWAVRDGGFEAHQHPALYSHARQFIVALYERQGQGTTVHYSLLNTCEHVH